MAKKKTELMEYQDAPLIVSRERFCSLLKEQITKGEELLQIDVPQVQQVLGYYGFSPVRRSEERVYYEEEAENDFTSRYKRWDDRNRTIYRSSFQVAESIYYHEYVSQIWSIWGTNTIKEYKDNINRLINHMQSDIERADLLKCSVIDSASVLHGRSSIPIESEVLSDEVFIVHGHNEEMKQSVARVDCGSLV